MKDISNLSLKLLSADEINKIESFRKSRQTAVLTILFSDIVNSSYATEKLGEQVYSQLRHIHDELFTRIMCADNSGIIIKQIGDSFLCVFAEPSTAVLRAAEFQRAIHSNKEHLTANGYTLMVRIGINLGQVVVENTLAMDIFGTHVNRAARLESIANAGQIITSHSVWENAVGWLKHHDDKKIRWVAYGKTKLKGIENPVTIFGFYPEELGKQKDPKIVSDKKKKNLILALCAVVIVSTSLMFLIKQLNNKSSLNLATEGKKTYYVQFDFSGFNNPANKFKIDTAALEQDLLTQVISVLSPDSVITEDDLIKNFSENGRLYIRHGSNNSDINSTGFFMDTLHLSGALFIKARPLQHEVKDSFSVGSELVIYYEKDSSYTASNRGGSYGLQNAGKQLRNDLQDMLLDTRHWDIQAYVISSNDSIVLFKTTKKAQLRQGTALRFMRGYAAGKEGLQERLIDLQIYIDYYKKNPADSDNVKSYREAYADIKKELKSPGYENGGFATGIDIEGKVIEMYDSTGKAVWHTTEPYPEKPRTGDIIYYK